jgi:hypothetical protein
MLIRRQMAAERRKPNAAYFPIVLGLAQVSVFVAVAFATLLFSDDEDGLCADNSDRAVQT